MSLLTAYFKRLSFLWRYNSLEGGDEACSVDMIYMAACVVVVVVVADDVMFTRRQKEVYYIIISFIIRWDLPAQSLP